MQSGSTPTCWRSSKKVSVGPTSTAAALATAHALFLWNFDAFMTEAVVRSPVIVSNTRGVFERPMAEYVLGLMLDRVIVSPHMSGDTVGYREVLFRQFAANLERWCSGLPLQNIIDKSKFEFGSRDGAGRPSYS